MACKLKSLRALFYNFIFYVLYDIIFLVVNMIPKRIIYCWFGGNEKPQEVQNCINTWHEHMPEWEFLEINESNFNINYNDYCKKAYEAKKWAFVSDIARLWALYEFGGVYLDTDVIVYQPLDKFLRYDFFTGFERAGFPVTATMGAVKNNSLVKEMLDVYKDKEFIIHSVWSDYETNTMIMGAVISKYFDNAKLEYQEKDNVAIFPRETFCYHETLNENVYTKHCMFGSWG